MHDMKMAKGDNYGSEPCIEKEGDKPRYPYGLTLHLDRESLEKLSIEQMPPVGSQMTLKAIVSVTEVSVSERSEGEPERRMNLQITEMELGAPGEKKDPSEELYGIPRDKTKEGKFTYVGEG